MSNPKAALTVPNLISARECFLMFTLPTLPDTFQIPLGPFAPDRLASSLRAVPSSVDAVRKALIEWGPEFSVFRRVTASVIRQIVGGWIAASEALSEAEVRAATVAYWDPFGDERDRFQAEGFPVALPLMEERDFFDIVRAYLEHSYNVPATVCDSSITAYRAELREQHTAGAMPSDAVKSLVAAISRQAGFQAFIV